MPDTLKKIKFCMAVVLLCAAAACFDSDEKDKGPAKEWTIMYYGAGDNNLEEQLMADINEMETVDVSKKANIVILMDRYYNEDEELHWTGDGNWSDTRAYEIHYETDKFNMKLGCDSKRIAIPDLGIKTDEKKELNMGSEETLEKFIRFCKTRYPARKYALVFSNHGDGWYYQENSKMKRNASRHALADNDKYGKFVFQQKKDDNPDSAQDQLKEKGSSRAVCWDETDNYHALNIGDIRMAIENGFEGKIDLLVYDACLMGTVEVAYEMKDVAGYMVASQEAAPWYGFPYNQILTKLSKDEGETSAAGFGKNFVNEFMEAYQEGTNIEEPGVPDDGMLTMSLVDLSKIDALVNEMDKWAGENPDKLIAFDDRFKVETSFVDYSMSDLVSLLQKGHSADQVVGVVSDAVVLSRYGSMFSSMCGLTVYFPKHSAWVSSSYDENKLEFAGAADNWTRYLRNYKPVETKDELELVSARIDDDAAMRKITPDKFIRMNERNCDTSGKSILLKKNRFRKRFWDYPIFPDNAAFDSGIVIGNDDFLSSYILSDPGYHEQTPTLIKKNASVSSYIMGAKDGDLFILDAKGGDGDLRLTITAPKDVSYSVCCELYNTFSYDETEDSFSVVISGNTYTLECPDDVEPEIDPETGEEEKMIYLVYISSSDGTFSQEDPYTITLETVE